MRKTPDLIDKKFGKLLVLEKTDERYYSHVLWRCRCDCGNIILVSTSLLNSGGRIQCDDCKSDKTSLIGKSYANVTVNSYYGVTKAKNSRWSCTCKCGNIIIATKSRLENNVSCGKNTCHAGWSGFGEITGSAWSSIKANAKKRNIEFNLTIEDGWNQFILQDRKCGLSGEDLILAKSYGHNETTASLDRIDSSKGYTYDNIWWIHKELNMLKYSVSMEELLKWCKLIINNDTSSYQFKYIKPDKIPSRWLGYKLISMTYYNSIKYMAEKRGICFNISIKDMWDIYIKQNGRCYITNIPIHLNPEHKKKFEQTASIDRIDSSKGYIKSNIGWTHKTLNKMKWDMTIEELTNWCIKINKYNE